MTGATVGNYQSALGNDAAFLRPPVPGRHLSRRLHHRRDRDELRDAGLALSQSVFRQRHLYLGGADLDGAGGADRRLFPRRLHRRPHRVGDRARHDRRRWRRSTCWCCRASPKRYCASCSMPIDNVRPRQPLLPRSRSCSCRSRCSASIRRSPSGWCCAPPSSPARCPAPSMASPPPARSSARWARRSSSFR